MFGLSIAGVAYLLVCSLVGGGAFYIHLRAVGNGALGRGLVAIPFVLSSSALALIGLCSVLYRANWLTRAGLETLALSACLVTAALTLCYYRWSAEVLNTFKGDRIIFAQPLGSATTLFHDLGDDAAACYLTYEDDADVLYVLGRVAGLDSDRSRRVFESLRAHGYEIQWNAAAMSQSGPSLADD